MLNKRKIGKRIAQAVSTGLVLGAFGLMAFAQDFPMHSGNPNRTGLPVDVNAGAFAPNVYNDSGRNFLRWWDPAGNIRTNLDNDETSVNGTTTQNPPNSWTDATQYGTVAFGYYQGLLGRPIYRFSNLVRGTDPDNPAAGATTSYTWTLNNLSTSNSYELSLNVPIGPTDVGVGIPDYRFPQKYWVVRISGVQGGDRTDLIDIDRLGGGYVRLGNNGNPTTTTFTPIGTQINVTLFNTAPVGDNGVFLDPRLNDDPSLLARQLVYADAVQVVTIAGGGARGSYSATPIVTRLNAAPPGGGATVAPYRTVAARNEETVIGDLSRTYNMASVTSYDFNGATIGSGLNTRFNKVFSWPAQRPFDGSSGEQARYARDRRDWVMATGKDRTDQKVQSDNLNGSASATANFLSTPGGVDNIGPDYLQTATVLNNATESATFAPVLPDGNYFVEVWLPGEAFRPTGIQVDILAGGVVVDTLDLDQNGPRGWNRMQFQPTGGYANTVNTPLSVVVTNKSVDATEIGKPAYADAVRFVRQSDLGIDSTPVQVTTTVQTGGGPANRDVLLMAMENGRIYCVDAHGDTTNGGPGPTYWVYPTEDAADPNAVVGEDGKDRIAEMPVGFDLSSALVANVGGEDLLFVASKNGKVYCLEMDGRGDGTTRRRWTYPDDYDPSAPNLPMQPGLQPIVGSVALGTAAGNIPIVIVPTQEGRIIALNAAGNAATRRTSVVWQYPLATDPVLGPVQMTPTVAFGRVYFGAKVDQSSTIANVYAVNEADGTLAWQQDGSSFGVFLPFGQSSPVAVPGSMLTDDVGGNWGGTPDIGQDRVFVCDSSGRFASLDAATGTVAWTTNEITSGSAGPLRFSFSTQKDNGFNIRQDLPTVYVSSLNGRLWGISAVGLQNRSGTNQIWGFALDGQSQVATLATGGFDIGVNPHSWLCTGDSNGILYAFNSNNDFFINPITPGIPPGQEIGVPNDDQVDELNSAIDADKFVVIPPAIYDLARERADDPSLGVNQPDALNWGQNEFITRRHYDFGETINILIYDLPILTGSNANYYLEFELSSPGRPTQRIQQPVRPYADDPNRGFVIRGIPLMTTGVNGVGPGPDFLTVRAVAPNNRGIQSTQIRLPKPPNFNPRHDCDFYVANPLALAYLDNNGNISSSVCYDSFTNPPVAIVTDPADARWGLYNTNGNAATDQNPSGGPLEPTGYVGPDLRSKGEPVAHGATGVQQLYVVDRSLMSMLMGRGLSAVRVGPRDVAWVKDVNDPVTGGVFKPLSANGVAYPGFEDYPLNVPNTSQDYPDVGRDSLGIVANVFGQAQNPLFQSGVDLNAPVVTQTDIQTWRQRAGFEAQMTRSLTPTIFELDLDVPRFQPPSNNGYFGSQVVYADFQAGGIVNDYTSGAYRTFGLGLNVAIDQKVVFKTPTIDLGSLPSGGGFNGGASGGPVYPWDPATLFSPWGGFDNLFQSFVIVNEGNVNNLDLRTAKYFFDQNGNRPVELFMPGQHELAWLDASLHLHTSLDPRFSASRRVGVGAVGYDAQGRNILQKPRPRDLTGTRFNVNPRSRPNSGLRVVGGHLYNTVTVPPGDPKMGVSAPVGAPSGQYLRRVFVFEDDDAANNFNADNPSLGLDEPYTDPGANLKFTVREGRITTVPTQKSAPMVDNLSISNPNLLWSNTQPTAMRDGLGNLFTAWSSNRLDAGNNPGFDARQRIDTDLTTPEKWRVYVGSLRSVLGNALGESPINELNAWTADTTNRWYRQSLILDPPLTLFDVNAGNGETLDTNSVSFGAPAFPTSGFFNQLDFPDVTGRAWNNGRYLAFLGEATKFDAAGNATSLSQIMLAPMVFNADGSISYNPSDIVSSPLDPVARKSRLSLIQVNNQGTDFASVYASTFSNGLGQIVWALYDPSRPIDQRWRQGSLRMGSAFENMGAPSAVLRRYQNGGQRAIVQLSWTGKVRGRRYSEAYTARLNASTATGFPAGRNPLQAYGGTGVNQHNEELTVDTTTGVYWASGLQWLSDQNSLDEIKISTSPLYTDPDIWDGNVNTRDFDVNSGVLKFNSRLGGEVLVDTTNGSVRFNGAVVRRDTRLYVWYRPTMLRVNEGGGANYRSMSSLFDDRFIGIRLNPGNPQRNLVGDLQNWIGDNGVAAAADAPIRWDRTVFAYTRTSGDGTAATRPYYQTMRPGVKLRYGIQTNELGQAFPGEFVVTWPGSVPASERYAQYDPATGRVFFLAGSEDVIVTVTYDAVDDTGRLVAQNVTETLRVRQMPEITEQSVPVEQVGNESSLSMSLDPLNGPFNNIDPGTGRRPGLLWFFWTSSRTGQPEIFFETVAPRFSPRRLSQ